MIEEMVMAEVDGIPEADEPEPAPLDDDTDDMEAPEDDAGVLAEPPHPVNWNLLTAEEAAGEWSELNKWVTWLRHTYGLPASVIPPFWHHRRGRSIALRGFWSTQRAPFGALRGQRHRTGVVHFRDGRSEQIERVDQPVTTLRNDEALVKVASHQGFLSG